MDRCGSPGRPEIVALGGKPDRTRLEHLAGLGVTEAAFGLPDKEPDEVLAYLDRLRGRLAG